MTNTAIHPETAAAQQPAHVLLIERLVRAYRSPAGGVQTVIDVPKFTMAPGQQTALAGESGSGKTTLLHLIAGILTPTHGSIVVDGRDITAMGESRRDLWRAQKIGYVFQTFNLLQGYSALQNVKLGMRFGVGVDEARAKHLLDRVGLSDRMHHRPRQLSVGQQQRVAVARAMANRPKLVLADEPTGNLDPVSGAQAMELIRSLCAEFGAALLLVTHEQRMLELFDDVRQLGEINQTATTMT